MHRKGKIGVAIAAALALQGLVSSQLAGAAPKAPASPAGCALDTSGAVKHVIYLQFDNVHYRRDNPNVPSDLQQMPHLLNFLQGNGTLFTNDHTILISHTAGGILSSLTGLYPDRNGQTVSNSYDYFRPDHTPTFTSSFKYWTDKVDATLDPLPNMVTDGQKTTPAPWVPFTRAGCDVGGVGTANIELENTSTSASGDMTTVFGQGSPEWTEAFNATTAATAKERGRPQTDFVGIAIHCSLAAPSKCAGNPNARTDALPDEPGGYTGFKALFGAKYVDPAVTGGNACVNDTAGQPITDPSGTCGFPGFDGMLAKNTLGYVAQLQENGVPVTYGYISDVHDKHVPNPNTDSFVSTAQGPGEAAHDQQLKDYDNAFASFFQDLANHGIDQSNALFVITVDEGDHFAGGAGMPLPDGTLQYASDANGVHTACAVLTNCPSNQIGEVSANIKSLLPTPPNYDIHFDDAPTFYLNGQPAQNDAVLRQFERKAAVTTAADPYVNHGQAVPIAANLADQTEEKALHMVNSDPNRTPSFTMFGNPDFFFSTFNPSYVVGGVNQCANTTVCVVPSFAWNHGDVQEEIGNTWVGFVGPGIANNGVDSTTWTDHTNLRPTIMMLAGLKDDYAHDGRVLTEALNANATPPHLHMTHVQDLAQVYEQLNAPFGQFGLDTLAASTKAVATGSATNDSIYVSVSGQIASLTTQRDALAKTIEGQLEAIAFDGAHLTGAQAKSEVAQAQGLIDQAHALAQTA